MRARRTSRRLWLSYRGGGGLYGRARGWRVGAGVLYIVKLPGLPPRSRFFLLLLSFSASSPPPLPSFRFPLPSSAPSPSSSPSSLSFSLCCSLCVFHFHLISLISRDSSSFYSSLSFYLLFVIPLSSFAPHFYA